MVGFRVSIGLSGLKLWVRWGKVSIKVKLKVRVFIMIKKVIKIIS